MIVESYAVVLVYSTSHAIRIEKLLKERKVDSKLIPVPRQISSDCGVCVRIARTQIEAARAVILAARIEIQDIMDFQ
jgi:bacterioferritin-associated ferredoxin